MVNVFPRIPKIIWDLVSPPSIASIDQWKVVDVTVSCSELEANCSYKKSYSLSHRSDFRRSQYVTDELFLCC